MRWNTDREGVGLPPPLRDWCWTASQKPLSQRFARQRLTHLADTTLVPEQARGEQVARDIGLPPTEVEGVCVRSWVAGEPRSLP